MPYTILGGEIVPEVKLSIKGQLAITPEQVLSHIAHTRSLGLPSFRELRADAKHLAVVGGGPSILERKDEIREFGGDVWAINGAHAWCQRNLGIDPVFITVDPHAEAAEWCSPIVTRALVESRVAPETIAQISGGKVYTFQGGTEVVCGSTTVTATPHLAMLLGYESLTLFGCESSLTRTTHAYQDEDRPKRIIVDCNGKAYMTVPDFYQQALELSFLIRELPEFMRERSGGLLGAMVANAEHSIHWISGAMIPDLSPQEVPA